MTAVEHAASPKLKASVRQESRHYLAEGVEAELRVHRFYGFAAGWVRLCTPFL